MVFNLKRKLNGKWLDETNSVKYIGIRIDSKFNWKTHIDDIALKVIRANAMLYKVRDFFNTEIYHALFESLIWGQNVYRINSLFIIQKKASRLIHFKERNTHTDSFFFK